MEGETPRRLAPTGCEIQFCLELWRICPLQRQRVVVAYYDHYVYEDPG